jgi:serine protease Do
MSMEPGVLGERLQQAQNRIVRRWFASMQQTGQPAYRTRFAFQAAVLFALPLLCVCTAVALAPVPSTPSLPYFHHANSGYLGVDLEDLTAAERKVLHVQPDQGVAIAAVDHDAPAGRAGLRAQDVVLRINGVPLHSATQARALLRKSSIGQSMTLTVLRNGSTLTRTVRLANRRLLEKQAWSHHYTVPAPAAPGTQSGQSASTMQPPVKNFTAQSTLSQPASPSASTSTAATPAQGNHPSTGFFSAASSDFTKTFGSNGLLMSWIPGTNALYTGIDLDALGPQLAQYFNVPDGTGLLVKSVDLRSPGERAGIRAGDIVLKVDDTPMTSRSKWQHVIHADRNHLLLIQIQRNGKPLTLTMSVHGTQ